MSALRRLALATALLAVPGCTALEQLRMFVQPPRVEEAENRPAEIRLLGPAANRPLGGAGVRIWATVTNPNRFGFTLSRLRGQLYLEDSRATEIDLPLGLPLIAGGTETIPIDLSISFSDLPGLADVIRRAIGRQPIAYRVDGTIGVDAGRYGQPEFGPLTWLRGEISEPYLSSTFQTRFAGSTGDGTYLTGSFSAAERPTVSPSGSAAPRLTR